jgi:hypothetical protein
VKRHLALGTVLALCCAANASAQIPKGILEALHTVDVKKLSAAAQPTAAPPPVAPPTSVPVANADQKAKLEAQLRELATGFRHLGTVWDGYATAVSLAVIVLALAGAIFGFLKKPVLAGVLSLVVTGVSGVAKAMPLEARASFYRTLYGQAYAIQLQTQLKPEVTVDEYNRTVDKIAELVQKSANVPSQDDPAATTETLIKALQAQP